MEFIKKIILMVFLLLAPAIIFAQSKMTGKVVDSSGEPVIGASVVQRGTTNGTVTDMNGNFTLNVPEKCLLQVTFIGYEKSIVNLDGQRFLKITLKENAQSLNEVVVVGYGTQKKATLTGSVSQVSGDEVLKGRGTSNVELSLQGAIPGLVVTRSFYVTDDPTITLRGGISTNSNGPLILIDGVNAYQWELNMLNPSDIESISVLKDAAASIYGAQAAGGVILVTTKRGKEGKLKITYNSSVNMNYKGKNYPAATGSQWAEMMLSADYEDTNHENGASTLWSILNFTSDTYKKIMDNDAFDWTNTATGYTYRIDPLHAYQPDYIYGKTYGTSQNLTFTGGSQNLRSETSLGYDNDRSLVKVAYDGNKKYNFRNNIDYQWGKYVKIETNTAISYKDEITPTYGLGYGLQDFYIFPLYTESGKYYYDNFGGNNVLAHLTQGGKTVNDTWLARLGGNVNVDLSRFLKGLSFLTKANIRWDYTDKKTQSHKIQMYTYYDENSDGTVTPSTSNNAQTGSQASKEYLKEENTRNMYQDYEFFLNYDRTFFNAHHISAMIGNTNELREDHYMSGYRSSSSSVDLDDLNVYDTTTDVLGSSAYKWSFVSYLARLDYDYKGKYMLEGTWRRDGSSRLVRKQRWQNYYGALMAWRISEEKFFKDNISFINNLKLRATWGQAGNLSSIGNYDAYSSISTSTTLFGTSPAKSTTAWISGVTDDTRTWEKVITRNLGADYALFNNRLSGSFDYFWRKNQGMLISVTYPATYGATAPATNSGSYKTHGWELTLGWQDHINKDLSYNVNLSLNDARTKIVSYEGATAISPGVNGVVQGYAKNSLWVYKTDGMFQNQSEVDSYYSKMNGNVSGSKISSVKQGTVNELTPGCVKRVDLNGDNDITTADLYHYGDTDPHYSMGLNLGLSYKGFDFSCFFQGVLQQYAVRSGQMLCAFYSGWTNTNGYFLGRTWTQADNPYYGGNSNAKFPVMSRNGNRNAWNYTNYNDINVSNCWYIRCKSMQIGYTLPKSLLSRINIENLRFWISGENLFDISKIKDGYDPETTGASSTYSGVGIFSSTISCGVDVSF